MQGRLVSRNETQQDNFVQYESLGFLRQPNLWAYLGGVVMPYFEDIADHGTCDFRELNFSKIYHGKPTLYLDQNILDKIVEYPVLIEEGQFAGYNCQVIYSNETLNEIERSGEPDKFLQVLESLEARRMTFEVDKNFRMTGAVIINPYVSPFTVYKKFLYKDSIDKIASKIIANNMQFIFSLFSNEASNSIIDYANETSEHFNNIHEQALEAFKSVKGEISDDNYRFLEKVIKISFQEQSSQLDTIQNSMLENMSNTGIDLKSNNGHNGIRGLEKITKVDGKILNNIKSPKILEKIYGKYTNSSDTAHITDFYLVSDKIYGRRLYKFEKVMNVYMMLNILGYKRDKGFQKKYKRLISANSDGQHLAYACYCDCFASEDKAFTEKAKAIFEYLNIKTRVDHITFTINNVSECID